MILRYRIDQNPGILALHSSYRGLGGIKRGCARHSCWMLPYRIVPYQAPSTPDIHSHHPRSTSYHTSTEPTRRAGLSLSLSLSLSPSPRPFIIAGFSSFPVPLLFLFFSFLSFLFLSFLPQGFLATLPRHRSPFPFLLAATAGFWCPVSRPAPNGA